METLIRKFGGYVAVALVSLALGYFAGREHIKYELRSVFQATAENIRSGLAGALPGESATATPSSVPAPSQSAGPAPIRATLVKKAFRDRDFQAGIYEEAITIEVSFTNLTSNDIRAFDGVLVFSDLLDNEIISSKIAINELVKADSVFTWEGQLDYNQFLDPHKRLRSEDQANIKVKFVPGKILFADGTKKQYD